MAWQNIFSHGSNHQKGVAIFINPLFEITFENSWEDEDGRIVLINAYSKTFKFSLCKREIPRTEVLIHIRPEGRRPEGCIWINTDVRGIYLTYFMILFMRDL